MGARSRKRTLRRRWCAEELEPLTGLGRDADRK